MSDQEQTQIYLITPPSFDLSWISGTLAPILDTVPVACLRLTQATQDASEIGRVADHLREMAHARDVPVVVDAHVKLVEPHGLDGVHLTGHADYRAARKTLGSDAIVGCYCGNSRHAGLTAGEMGADYVAFGPLQEDGLGTAEPAEHALFSWWSEMIEVPVVAEGGLDQASAKEIAPVADFMGLGPEIWTAEDPKSRLLEYVRELG